MKAKRAVRFVPLAVCALLAAGFANGARPRPGRPRPCSTASWSATSAASSSAPTSRRVSTARRRTIPTSTSTRPSATAATRRGSAPTCCGGSPRIHHLRFLYFDDTTTRRRVIDADIAWGDNIFTAGGEVKLEDQLQDRRAGLRVRLHPPADVRAQRQLRRALDGRVDQALAATRSSPTRTATALGVGLRQEGHVSAPLPVIGLRAGWVVAPNVYLDAQGAVLQGQGQRLRRQRVTDLRAGATWMFTPNFGLGIGYNRFTTQRRVREGEVRRAPQGRLLGHPGVPDRRLLSGPDRPRSSRSGRLPEPRSG